jgi:hypothetical protein
VMPISMLVAVRSPPRCLLNSSNGFSECTDSSDCGGILQPESREDYPAVLSFTSSCVGRVAAKVVGLSSKSFPLGGK